jgi:hypothetical protein
VDGRPAMPHTRLPTISRPVLSGCSEGVAFLNVCPENARWCPSPRRHPLLAGSSVVVRGREAIRVPLGHHLQDLGRRLLDAPASVPTASVATHSAATAPKHLQRAPTCTACMPHGVRKCPKHARGSSQMLRTCAPECPPPCLTTGTGAPRCAAPLCRPGRTARCRELAQQLTQHNGVPRCTSLLTMAGLGASPAA